MSGRKVEVDEVTIPAPLLESSSPQKSVPVIPRPISEEANDDDHETSDQGTTEPRRSTSIRSAPEWYGNPVLEVMLLDHTTKKDTSVTFWVERKKICHTYDTSMTIIVTKPGIIIDVVGSYFYDKKS